MTNDDAAFANEGAKPTPILMGIVNVTPDSFSDGGKLTSVEGAVEAALLMVEEGAEIVDIGGESTRPGADFVPEEEEIARVLPVIEALRPRIDVKISIDTRKPNVAHAAVMAGADIWNDVSALSYDAAGPEMAAALGCDIILMHAKGDPKTMQDKPAYGDVVEEVAAFLTARLDAAIKAGVARDKIMIDPGIGFGKTLAHNLALLNNTARFSKIAPVLVGASRKRFIAALDRAGAADLRLGGSIAAAVEAARRGAAVLRVHDVAATRQALAIWQAIDKG